MKLQEIYDLRDLTGFCSGNDLHKLFNDLTGDPSPSGKVEVGEEAVLAHPLGDEIMSLLNSPARLLLADIRKYTDV